MSRLYAEFVPLYGDAYFLCEKHARLAFTATTGHLAAIYVPPQNEKTGSFCWTCAAVVHYSALDTPENPSSPEHA